MSPFEFFFSLFGLLLGFSLIEVLGGLARAIDTRLNPAKTIRLGWLTPMLGFFVMLDLISFWSAAWSIRDQIGVGLETLFGGMLFASAYYLAAHLVFPNDLEGAEDLDAHYFRVRRIVLGVLLVLALVQIGFYASIPRMAAAIANPGTAGMIAVFLVLMAAGMFVRSGWANKLVLGLLSARYLLIAFT